MKKLLIALTVAIYISNFILFIVSHSVPLSLKGKATVKSPYFFEEDVAYMSKITEVASCGNCLYVLYDNKNILSCYNLQGKYICSYYFDMSRNGNSQLYYTDDTLYLEARGHNVYAFQNGDFIAFYDSERDAQAIKEIREQIDTTHDSYNNIQENYVRKGTSILRILPDGQQKVVLSGPEWYIMFQNDTAFLVVNLVALVILYLLYRFFA